MIKLNRLAVSTVACGAVILGASLLPVAAVLAVSSCGVFSSTTTDGVTTVTVNTAEAAAYAQALANLGSDVLAIPGVSGALGSNLSAVETAVNDLSAIPATINAYAAGAQSFQFNTTSVPEFITSLEQDVSTLTGDAGQLTTLPSGATSYISAITTVANAVSALVTVASVAAPAPSAMSLADALALAKVQVSP